MKILYKTIVLSAIAFVVLGSGAAHAAMCPMKDAKKDQKGQMHCPCCPCCEDKTHYSRVND